MARLLFLFFAFILTQAQANPATDSTKLHLDGYWVLADGRYAHEIKANNHGCPTPDAWHTPYALGSHLYFHGDSVSLFRYPYQYYGTFKYHIQLGVLYVTANHLLADQFGIRKAESDTLLLQFEEKINVNCFLSAEARYKPFKPDALVIEKLTKDSVSFESLIGQWWYLRKQISTEDGSEPQVLNYPKGMPDSIFVSSEIIHRNGNHPFVALDLNKRIVNMYFKDPAAYSFRLQPEFKKDDILFARFADYRKYGGGLDTSYFEVIYYSQGQ